MEKRKIGSSHNARKGKKEKLKRKQSQLYGRKKGKMDKASKGSEGKAR